MTTTWRRIIATVALLMAMHSVAGVVGEDLAGWAEWLLLSIAAVATVTAVFALTWEEEVDEEEDDRRRRRSDGDQ